MTAAPFPGRVSVLNRWFGRAILEPFPWRTYGEAVNAHRRGVGLPAQTGAEHLARRRAMPMLHAISRHVMPLPADWPETCHVTGYWFRDGEPGWTPPPALEAFLADGPVDEPAPVAIGFGSMTGRDPEGASSTPRPTPRLTPQLTPRFTLRSGPHVAIRARGDPPGGSASP
jgi:hypothetical protein